MTIKARWSLVVGAFFVAVAISVIKAEVKSCPAETDGAVLDAIYPKFHGEAPDLDGMSGREITKESVRVEQHQIDCIRLWATSKTNGCIRSSYLQWLDYYQGQLNDAKHELATRSEERGQTEYERKRAEERRRLTEFEAKHPIPQAPQCVN